MLSSLKSKLFSAILSIVAIMALTAWPAFAQEAENAQGEAVLITGGSVLQTVVLTETASTSVACCADAAVASVAITIAAGTSDLILAEWSAETACSGGGNAGVQQCLVRARAVNTATGAVTYLSPSAAGEFVVFDSEDPSASYAESHSHQWAARLGAGTYRVQILARAGGGATFFMDDRTFTVMRIN